MGLSDWALWGQIWVLRAKSKVCHLCVLSRGATGLSCSCCGRIGIQMGQILVQVLVLVSGCLCPTLKAALGKRGGIDFGRLPLGARTCCLPRRLQQPSDLTGRADGGGRQGAEQPPVPAWAGCWRQLCAQELVQNVLASRSCCKRHCWMIFTPPGTFSHLFCAPTWCCTHPWVPPSPLMSFRGLCLPLP